jgi:hypothetical protein
MAPTTAAAATIDVPADFPLSVAIAVAQDGDEIVISPTGSPHLVFPGLEFADTSLTVRGAFELIDAPPDTCPTDTNADGFINGADLVDLHAKFGSSCL